MRLRKQWLGSGLAAVAVLFTACSQDGTDSVFEPVNGLSSTTTEAGYIDVWKFGPAGTYSFTASETGSGLYGTSFTVDAGSIWTIWQQDDPTAGDSDVTITETVTPGTQVDSIVVVKHTSTIFTSKTVLTGTNTVTLAGANNTTDFRVKFYNSEVPPPPPPPTGGEGCTPGYWRQSQHFDSWTGYDPNQSFDAVFGVTYGGTLLDAVWAKGGDANALARHAVAALLNSTSIEYAAGTADVIAAVQAAFASGDFETQKNIFDGWNNASCPLN